jgi:hypothetical protein
MSTEPAVLVRRSTLADLPGLARLAAASGTLISPAGHYLVAEVRGTIVAAAPLESGAAVHDPTVDTSDIRELLMRWALNLRSDATRMPKAA